MKIPDEQQKLIAKLHANPYFHPMDEAPKDRPVLSYCCSALFKPPETEEMHPYEIAMESTVNTLYGDGFFMIEWAEETTEIEDYETHTEIFIPGWWYLAGVDFSDYPVFPIGFIDISSIIDLDLKN